MPPLEGYPLLSRNARESIKMEGSEMVTVVQSKDIQNKCEKKSINKSHLTRHLDCPSAPLGEVEPVRLDLVLGDLLLGLVLKSLLDEGFLGGVVSSAGAELKLGYCRK